MTLVELLPHVNALLNTVSAVLLSIGYYQIKSGNRRGHRVIMTAALAVSALFLVGYVTYHFSAPVFEFPGQGWVRPLYFTMLASHVVLATAMTPLAAMTAWRAWRGWKASPDLTDTGVFAAHKAIARWTLPVWLYVTVTGVLVYFILYHVYGSPT